MASEFAAPPTHLPQSDSMDTSSQEPSFDAPTVNGDHKPTTDTMQQDDNNSPDAPAEASLSMTETAIDTKFSAPPQADPNPAGPTPVDDITSGIQPIADFIPKDASNLSNPTPPPDEPFTTGEANVDVEMEGAEPEPQPRAEFQPLVAQTESSLVRPREDDGEDEPAAKRSKVEEAPQPEVGDSTTIYADAQGTEELAEIATTSVIEPSAQPDAEATEVSMADPDVEPSASEPPVPEESTVVTRHSPEPSDSALKVEDTQSVPQPPEVPQEPAESGVVAPITEAPTSEKPADAPPAGGVPSGPAAAPASGEKPAHSTAPMTTVQKSSLIDKMKNLKKTKSSLHFLKPVDPVALNIPTYPDIIKEPMDLGTMESRLKSGHYKSVQEFADDFALIVNNSRRFNGDQHVVTQAALSMEAYFNKMMQTIPTADVAAPLKTEKKRSPSISREKPPRRESRVVAAPAPAPAPVQAPAAATSAAAPPAETYALQSDGTPQIRRQSSNRPARAIKPPQNREIPYAKPKRKEHQLELRFCEHVLDEIRSPKYGTLNHVFLMPVDPVALNIPHYRQVIKQPMDLSTMSQKLKNGQYGTASEFKKDFDLMVRNCLTFNPVGNAVRDLGIQLQREFETLWSSKEKWERKNQPASTRASSASADDESAVEDEDDDEEDDEKAATIRKLQQQLADMQSAIAGMAGEKASKSKKAKPSKGGAKKIGSVSAAPKSKAATKPAKQKKQRTVTYDEKQEISEAVAKMDEKQVGRLTEIITQNCAKYRDMEEMELEIDDLPNNVQLMLLDYVRGIFGNPNKKKAREPSPDDAAALDDDDFEPERGARGGKRKKHKPMGKQEQQAAIDSIQRKLAQFNQPGMSGSESPTASSFNAANAQPETSGDEESEESEEE
ncbi:transcription initiation at TATA-containing promoter protein [Vermiconidia calcicola]|uniref:Transcription initiation at TATA-containing promoter protein n=1 Tax=Vermiconidia calcicola TaxID=1690605 RepID=A0ACC3MNZ6_9PEZI|nr:transcription initiation at TATA-containing promoter protein [Vermiconidia calcicola]